VVVVAVALLLGCGSSEVQLANDPDAGVTDAGATPDGATAADSSSTVDAASSTDLFTSAADGADASCVPEGERPHAPLPDQQVASLEEFAAATFNSNPPSSGAHCATPGQYSAYTVDPLPRCNYLENLARGGVVLAYKCTQKCDQLVSQLSRALIGVTDPDCPAVRVVITADPALDVGVAAAAWGYTWKSDCFDEAARASLSKFINAHLGSRGEAPRRSPAMCK
jgi:hypothetical protein